MAGHENRSKRDVKDFRNADIKRHMEVISKVSAPPGQGRFVPLKGPGREALARQESRRKGPKPRNHGLYDDDSESSGANRSNISDDLDCDENEMRATVKSNLGGDMFSNRRIEQRWKNLQAAYVDKTSQREEGDKTKEQAPKDQDVFAKNACMSWIVRHRQEVSGDKATDAGASHQTPNVRDNSCRFNFVADPVESDFYYRKIANPLPEDHFIIDHIGRVTRTTARKQLIENVEPADFEFSRRKKQ